MKKLTALLLSCMLITSAFASCGSDGDDSDSGSKVSASDTSDGTDTSEEDTSEDDEDTTTKTKTTKAKTTKETTTEPDETEDSEFVGKWEIQYMVQDGEKMTETASGEPIKGSYQLVIEDDGTGTITSLPLDEEYAFTWKVKGSKLTIEEEDSGDISYGKMDGSYLVISDEEEEISMAFKSVKKFSGWEGGSSGGNNGGGSSSGEVDSKLVGTWNTEEDGFSGAYNYKEDGMGDVILYSSEILYVDGDTFMFSGTALGPDTYTFNNGKLVLDVGGTNILTMTKVTGAKDEMDGKFQITGGYLYDQYEPTFGADLPLDLAIEFDGKDSKMIMANCFQFTADGSEISIVKGGSLFNNTKFKYTIKGDTLTLTASGAKQELTRAK